MADKLVAANWKMNGTKADGKALVDALLAKASAAPPACQLLVCPPYTLLDNLAGRLAGGAIALGAQDCHAAEKGAHTGDVSAAMLADLGCSHVIVGHSERRQDHGETSEDVNAKATAAQGAGLTAVVCIGETLEERDQGRTLEVVGGQLEASIPEDPSRLVVAYEPVWAIGTGRTPTPEDVAAVHAAMREQLVARFGEVAGQGISLLYGGSVKPDNAAVLLGLPDVDGALVGGASLKAEDFWSIALASGGASG